MYLRDNFIVRIDEQQRAREVVTRIIMYGDQTKVYLFCSGYCCTEFSIPNNLLII